MPTDSSTKPYLIRAIRDWADDQGYTPHLLVDAEAEGVKVPQQFVEENKIVLNISAQAVGSIELNNEWILFNARFGGVAHNIDVPISAVLAIFARENGQGLFFQQDDPQKTPPPAPNDERKSAVNQTKPSRPHLKLVE